MMTKTTRGILLAAAALGAAAAFGGAVPIYPYNDGRALNLRVPTYAKPDAGAKGAANPFGSGAAFSYRLSEHLKFTPGSWRFDFFLRSQRQGHSRDILTVEGNAGTIVFGNGSNRVGKNLPYLTTQVPSGKVTGNFELPHEWTPASIVSEKGALVVTVGGRELMRTPANGGYVPLRVKVGVWYVDELVITGRNGTFTLDWENNTYAGRCEIASDGGVSANVMGFDTMVISDDKSKRDCPAISVANTTGEPKSFRVAFDYRTEVAGEKAAWTQAVDVGAGAETLAFVEFPKGLHDDIYHMTIRCPELGLDETRHFMFARRRGEAKGDDKFGWHEVCSYLFGGYMDAIPVTYPVRYMYPHGVYDDSWLEDFKTASLKGDPETPLEAWNWPSVAEWLRVEGRKIGFCVHNYPAYPYSEDKKIPGLCDQEWHKRFLRVLADRYRDNAAWWEVENEPNCGGKFFGEHPEHYVHACKSMKEVMSVETPNVPVFGISTQGNWIDWMDAALAGGAGRYLDGVSFHTYSGVIIEDTAMPEILRETRKRFPGKPMINTETGVPVAAREKIDEMLTPEYIADQRAKRAPGFNDSNGWCNPIDEVLSAISMTRNVLVNFQQGTRVFTFFFPTFGQWDGALKCHGWKRRPHDFTAHACTPDGTMSPNRLLLAGGVLACQLEPALLDGLRPVDGVFGVNGVVFPKAGGGKVAAIWAIHGPVDVTVRADVPELECVGMQGERSVVRPLGKKKDGLWTYQVALDRTTRYLHTKGKAFEVVPVPLTALYALQASAEAGEIVAEFENRLASPRTVAFAPAAGAAVSLEGGRTSFTLAPGERRELRFAYRLREVGKDVTVRVGGVVDGSIPLAGQTVIRAVKGASLESGKPQAFAMDKDEQVVLGHADDLTSLLEASKFWAGADDLSAVVSLDWDDRAFVVKADVVDRQFRLADFPGINGTSVEMFCDFRRPGKGLGDTKYSDGCYQFLIESATASTASVLRVFSPQVARLEKGKRVPMPEATGRRTKEGYSLTVRVPWRLATKDGTPPETFGFDFGANCSYPDRKGRRAQMMLFGKAGNANNAADFGRIRLVGERNNAVIPVPKLERDGYDWHARHAAALRPDVKGTDPELVLLGDSILHRWAGGGTESFGTDANAPAIWKKWFGGRRVLNLGFGWDRTQNVLWRIREGELDGLKPKGLVLLIGTNNITPWGNARQNTGEEVGAGVEAIVRAVREKLPETKILVIGILPRGNPNDWFVWADEANAASERRCAGIPGVTFLRLRGEFLNEKGFPSDDLYYGDHVHLSDAGFDVLGRAIADWMKGLP